MLREEWKVRLEFEIIEDLANVKVSLALVEQTGSTICTYWSKEQDLTVGTYFVDFDIHILLGACNINFIVGLSTRMSTLYYEENLGQVSISELAKYSQPENSAKGHGILLVENHPEIVQYK